jgi:hypothetical protein
MENKVVGRSPQYLINPPEVGHLEGDGETVYIVHAADKSDFTAQAASSGLDRAAWACA